MKDTTENEFTVFDLYYASIANAYIKRHGFPIIDNVMTSQITRCVLSIIKERNKVLEQYSENTK